MEEEAQTSNGTGKTWVLLLISKVDGASAGILIEGFNVLLSLVLVAVAIADTYSESRVGAGSSTYVTFEIVCTVFFAIDYFLHIYAAQDHLGYLITPVGIVDFFTIVPTILALSLKWFDMNGVLPLLRIARIFRILAVLRLYRVMVSRRGFEYQLGVLIFLLFSLILVAAGVFQILEQSYYTDQGLEPLQFHQAIYFVFVTISTVGYGDIFPHTTQGQLFVIFIIVVIITVIPTQVARLMELSARQSDYMHSYTLRRRSIYNGGHVVVTGHVRLANASGFLREFYRARQGRVNMDVVFLVDHLPSPDFQALLLNVRYRRRTTYLRGSILRDRDAKRAHVAEAAAVFVLANKSDPRRAEATDALSILQALAVDKFRGRVNNGCQQICDRLNANESDDIQGDDRFLNRDQDETDKMQQSRSIRCFVEILSPKHTPGLRATTGVEVALNASLLRTAILARSIMCPGATALILNLVYSPTERLIAQARRSKTPWVAEYSGGLQNLIFPVVLPDNFDGMLFEHATETLYLNLHVMLFALYDRSAAMRGEKRIRLSPFGETLEQNDLVFLIAPSSSVAQHAVDSLEERVDFEPEQYVPLEDHRSFYTPTVAVPALPAESNGQLSPVLVFSSDTVLDRQSFQRNCQLPPILSNSIAEDVETLDASASSRNRIASSASTTTTSPPPKLRAHGFQEPPSILKNHILICGPFAQGHRLACCLDNMYSQEGCPTKWRPNIVLLVKAIPAESDLIRMPANVFIECGVSQNVEDLLRVQAHEAANVVFISGRWEGGCIEERHAGSSKDLDKYLEDYHVIMSTRALQTVQDLHHEHLQMQQQVKNDAPTGKDEAVVNIPTMECSVVKSHDSINYFAHRSRGDNRPIPEDQDTRSDDEDSITGITDMPCNEYQNERILDQSTGKPCIHLGCRKRRRKQLRSESEHLSSPCFTPAYAAGEVLVDSVLDTLLCQSFFNPYATDLVRALAGDYSSPEGDKASMLRYFSTEAGSKAAASPPRQPRGYPVLRIASISRELEDTSFGEVFSRALRQQVFVIGIYRRAQAADRGNVLPYVVTCPESPIGCQVERGDKLYVLTTRPAPVCI